MIFVDFTFFQRRLAYFKSAETPLEKHTRGAAFFLLQTLLSFCDICSKMGRVVGEKWIRRSDCLLCQESCRGNQRDGKGIESFRLSD